MQRLVILGSTGSIGRNTLDVVRRARGFDVVGLSCFKNIELLFQQIEEFKPKFVCVAERVLAKKIKQRFPHLEVLEGKNGLIEMVQRDDVDFVVNALVGTAGLLPTYYTVLSKKRLALANKESLVIAGKIITDLARGKNVEIVPIDSEHSAIYQCLEGRRKEDVEKLILTASGGPFFDRGDFDSITVDEALSHPNWNMGKKITIDSATMMNKGFEVIEAHWLFGVPHEKIEVVIHKESIVHSAVEFIDGSIIAQIANHDMRIPIAYALFKPNRVNLPFKLDLASIGSLSFEKPDFNRFPTLTFAYEALESEKKNLGLVLNVADELAVKAFLEGRIRFKDIFWILEKSMEKFESNMPGDILGIEQQIERVKMGVLELISKIGG